MLTSALRTTTPPAIASPRSIAPLPSRARRDPSLTSSRLETLLRLENDPLAGAPNPVLIERHGNDATLVAWNPGDPLRIVHTFPNVFRADEEIASLSPDGHVALAGRRQINSGTSAPPRQARLVRLDWDGRLGSRPGSKSLVADLVE